MRAFLDTIAFSEGADYNTLFGGGTFSGYADHPRREICTSGYCSTAAGRYQFLSKAPDTWDSLHLPDFSPESQDKGAAILIDRDGHATADVEAGNFESAVNKCNGIWASFPGSPYGQPTHSMAELRKVYDAALAKYGGSGSNPAQQAASTQPAIQDVATTKPVEVSQRGTEIIIECGYEIDQLIAYHFIHTGTTTEGRFQDKTTFEGQCVRWLMTRRIKNSAYSNITLKQLAERVCKNYGLELQMEGNGPTYQHLDQTGITDYELLLRECRAIGYVMQDKGKTLIIRPIRPNFTGFVITQDMLKSIQFSDRANKDMQRGTVAAPGLPSGENKVRINRLTGQPEQQNPEDTTGTGKLNADKQISLDTPAETVVNGLLGNLGITGSPVQRLHGTPAGGGKALAGIASNIASNPTYRAEEESKTPVTARTDAPDPVTGLPRQEIGSIDLADGTAQAQELRADSDRVKGYESKATLIMTPESLELVPGDIIGISYNVAPGVFSREWRVSSVKHTVSTSGAETEIEFYSPQAKKAGSGSTAAPVNLSDSMPLTGAVKEGWASPMPIAGNSSEGPEAEFGYARGRLHAGLDFGGNGSGSDPDAVYAACNGTITFAGDSGNTPGYGNVVEITRADSWWCRYAHLASWTVQQGQQVTIGQKVGVRGNSGTPVVHLHFEIRDPQQQPHNPRDFLPQPQIPEL